MAPAVTPPRGMRDFLPADKARRERALSTIRSVYAAHGFDEIETPALEESARLHSGLGGDNEKLAFAVLKRGITGPELHEAAAHGDPLALADLGLRFDLTVPLARYYASNRAALPPVFRALQIGPVWRAERPQKGRFRQFVQADIDVIGEPGQLAEVELITATSAALEALGLRECTIRINDRRILSGILEHCGFDPARSTSVLIAIDKLDKIGVAGVVDELAEFGADAAAVLGGLLEAIEPVLAAGGAGMSAAEILAVLPEGIDPDAVAELEALAGSLSALPEAVALRFDPTLVRGMGYYTGTIFEIAHPASGSSVGGGGRYDGMIGRFLGQEVPACGFSIGFERILELLPAEDGSAERVLVLYEKDAHPERLVAAKLALIAGGASVRLERKAKNLRAQLERAAAEGFALVGTVSAEGEAVPELRPLA